MRNATENDAIQDTTTESPEAGTPETDTTDPGEGTSSREAAKYRRQLREAEAERDTLRNEIDSTKRAKLVEALNGSETVADMLAAQADTYGELYTEAGEINTETFAAARTELSKAFGIEPQRMIIPAEGGNPLGSLINKGDFTAAFAPKK